MQVFYSVIEHFKVKLHIFLTAIYNVTIAIYEIDIHKNNNIM